MPHTPIGVGYKPGFSVIRKDPTDNVWDLHSNWHLPAALSSLSHIPNPNSITGASSWCLTCSIPEAAAVYCVSDNMRVRYFTPLN